MTIRFGISVAALLGLAACGGGGAGNLGGNVDLSDFPNASYGELDSATDRLVSYSRTLEATSFSGTATYYGVILMAGDLDPRVGDATGPGVSSEGVIGQVELMADFTDVSPSGYTVDGTATNFYQTGINTSGSFEGNPNGSSSGALGGSLTLSATGVTGNFFNLSASGTVDGDSVSGTFNDNLADPDNLNRIAGFKSPSGTTPTALWVRTAEGSGLTVDGVANTWDAVIAAD